MTKVREKSMGHRAVTVMEATKVGKVCGATYCIIPYKPILGFARAND